jgi:hypothetical protein
MGARERLVYTQCVKFPVYAHVGPSPETLVGLAHSMFLDQLSFDRDRGFPTDGNKFESSLSKFKSQQNRV